ncbi:hypothetical protein [Paenibacillus wynnii]|uniref:hypothetical protein n=1 Tax=Paenibacillus wynnii TaxID=268407 RepID=UPI002790A9C7|nr:hypothetical protein [Paenibacillus wynnii]MDQ0192128.1 hypothetical protein [Paenibacillus wynnii]
MNYNYIKKYFDNLNSLVKDKPLVGLVIMIAAAASFALLIYMAGKDIGELLYSIQN